MSHDDGSWFLSRSVTPLSCKHLWFPPHYSSYIQVSCLLSVPDGRQTEDVRREAARAPSRRGHVSKAGRCQHCFSLHQQVQQCQVCVQHHQTGIVAGIVAGKYQEFITSAWVDSGPLIIPYMVENRHFATLYGMITRSVSLSLHLSGGIVGIVRCGIA